MECQTIPVSHHRFLKQLIFTFICGILFLPSFQEELIIISEFVFRWEVYHFNPGGADHEGRKWCRANEASRLEAYGHHRMNSGLCVDSLAKMLGLLL